MVKLTLFTSDLPSLFCLTRITIQVKLRCRGLCTASVRSGFDPDKLGRGTTAAFCPELVLLTELDFQGNTPHLKPSREIRVVLTRKKCETIKWQSVQHSKGQTITQPEEPNQVQYKETNCQLNLVVVWIAHLNKQFSKSRMLFVTKTHNQKCLFRILDFKQFWHILN